MYLIDSARSQLQFEYKKVVRLQVEDSVLDAQQKSRARRVVQAAPLFLAATRIVGVRRLVLFRNLEDKPTPRFSSSFLLPNSARHPPTTSTNNHDLHRSTRKERVLQSERNASRTAYSKCSSLSSRSRLRCYSLFVRMTRRHSTSESLNHL
jgi:hypothetical protein